MKTLIRFSQILLVASIVFLVGCSSTPKMEPEASGASGATGGSGSTAAIKQYPMHGKIVTVDVAKKIARIDAGAIGDWMGAMTMDYKIKDDAGLAKLAPGMEIDATVNVQGNDDADWITDIKPVAK